MLCYIRHLILREPGRGHVHHFFQGGYGGALIRGVVFRLIKQASHDEDNHRYEVEMRHTASAQLTSCNINLSQEIFCDLKPSVSSLSSKFSSFQIWRPVQIWEIFGQTSRVVLLGSVTQTVRCQCMLPWYGMLWCGCGIWYDINWYTMVWQKHGTARRPTAQHGVAIPRHSTATGLRQKN